MKLSKKGEYALRVMRHLAAENGGKPLSTAYLARTEGVPLKYLEQVLSQLRNQGLLLSTHGKDGGYTLRRPAADISLGDIIRAVDGPLAPIPCASRTAPARCPDCPNDYDTCWLRHLMLSVRDNISDVLDRESLAAMTGRTARRPKARRKK
ncbi:MAG: Rrf2 family transcriptional regulator [Deltaproteobacteria bacterium]|nr:Rrf2 family transcriptional regulator [Deltaproteobacteria bacterium]